MAPHRWGEQDDINRFIALFLPLELLLAGQSPTDPDVSNTSDVTSRQLRGILKQLIHKHGGQNSSALRDYLANLEPKRPALLARFTAYAQKVGLPTWESDVAKFNRFNRMRNDLFHGRGLSAFDHETFEPTTEAPLLGKLNVETAKLQQALRSLTDLTERYVSQAVFGDTNIYLSRDRRKGLV